MPVTRSSAPARRIRVTARSIMASVVGAAVLGGAFVSIPAAAAVSDGPLRHAGAALTLTQISEQADAAVTAAEAALDDAATVDAEVAASGLDLGAAPTAVDTTELAAAVEDLDDRDVLPVFVLPALTTQAEAEAARVADLTAALRTRLDEAAAAKAEAEAAAAAAAAAAAEQRAREEAAAALAAVNTPEGAQANAREQAAGFGWGEDQMGCLVSLWQKESGWNYQAYNASSGATGIPQALPGGKMASAGADWQTNAATQIAWGLQYIADVYGTPCSAWGHSQATDWY